MSDSLGATRARSERTSGRRRWAAAAWVLSVLLVTGGSFLLGTWLTLQVAVRSPEIETPALIGQQQQAAEQQLAAHGLVSEVMTRRHDAVVPAGHVIDQVPAARTRTKRGRPVRLVVSLGAQQTAVPRLVGSGAQRAQLELSSAGLAASTAKAFSGRVPRGDVIAQDPPAGSGAVGDSGVRLLVSAGPRAVEFLMPDLSGRAAGAATTILARYGFQRLTVDGAAPDPLDQRLITTQRPAAGSKVSRSATVTLTTAPPTAAAPLETP